MRKEIAEAVFPIFTRGLDLRARLEQGERVNLTRECNDLCQQLLRLPNRPEFVGEGERFTGDGSGPQPFQGIRYALVCWLDDLIILGLSPHNAEVSTEWRDRHSVERELYQVSIRGEQFWLQENQARQTDADVIEVFSLCVLLGFRGDRRGQPAELQDWRQSIEEARSGHRSRKWPDRPPERPVPSDVSPRLARKRLFPAMVLLCLVVGVVAAAVTFSLVLWVPG